MGQPMRAVAHVGVSVPDIDAAVEWYGKVFGFEPILPVGEIDVRAGGHFADLCIEIFGEEIKLLKMAHLATANGTAIELFQFIEPAYEAPEDNFEYWRGGIYHFCVVASDIEDQVALIEREGGTRRSELGPIFEGMPYKACYCEDPWGTIIEVISHSHERVFSNLG